MDPNLFRIDLERLFEVLLAIIVLAFFLERALAVVFEHRLYVNNLQEKGLKEVISFLLAFLVCRYWDFDAVSIVLLREHTQLVGIIVTAAVVAGGSKASIGLFHSVLGLMSNAEQERRRLRKLAEQR